MTASKGAVELVDACGATFEAEVVRSVADILDNKSVAETIPEVDDWMVDAA